MNWKLKAKIQNIISLIPGRSSYEVYYWLQRIFGGLKTINPTSELIAAINLWGKIKELNYEPREKVFFEVGTGRTPILPLALWLMGAKRIITVDINPYLKEKLIRESIKYIKNNRNEVKRLFGNLLDSDRFEILMNFYQADFFNLHSFFITFSIDYVAPGDASNTNLNNQSIDFHISFNVLEHIPSVSLNKIIKEGNRITKHSGLFIHYIDYSDHFWHSDKSISPINFLQYSDSMWGKIAGNRYMYMNRLRHDDFIAMFTLGGHYILLSVTDINKDIESLLENNFIKLDDRFKLKSRDILSIVGSWIISKKSDGLNS